jgi:hypothetical protein
MLSSRYGRLVGSFAGVVAVGSALVGAHAAHAAPTAQSQYPGAVTLNPASGATSSKPTWSTSTACPAGLRGSAVFREVHADGTTNSISQANNSVAAPFGGTLQANIAQIQAAGGIRNGGNQEFVVICFSAQSLTGTSHWEMRTFVTYSADGTSYTSGGTSSPSTSGTASASPSPSSPSLLSPTVSSPSPSPTSAVAPAPAPIPVDVTLPVTG